jgi:hypothetical protein
MSDLQAYQPLVQFYKHYFKSELEASDFKEMTKTSTGHILPKIRSIYDFVEIAIEKNFSKLAHMFFIHPIHFLSNL